MRSNRLARLTHGGAHRRLTGPRASGDLIGLDSAVVACVFDLDGVLTVSPGLHSSATTGLANRKNDVLRRRLGHGGVSAFDGSRRFLEVAHEAGLRCAVVSASANTDAILGRSGLRELVDAVVDGAVIQSEHLRGKPAPDSVLAACRRLAVNPERVASFETTHAGIAAGRSAGVHSVIGVDRSGRAASLVAEGADRIVSDLAELLDPLLSAV